MKANDRNNNNISPIIVKDSRSYNLSNKILKSKRKLSFSRRKIYNCRFECIETIFLLSAVGDGQEVGPDNVRAKRGGAETADTSA